MKIATWNLERLEKRKNQQILEQLVAVDADILMLTETNSVIQLDNYNCVSTSPLLAYFDNINYKPGETRVSILTKYKTATQHQTFDNYTTVCTDIETPFGLLTVYGSIIGVFANRQPRFDQDLNGHLSDFKKLFPGKNICLAGDFNVTFSGRPWPSKKARQTLVEAFKLYGLTNTTEKIENTVDHIMLSNEFLKDKAVEIKSWNTDKKLSDHVGHLLQLTP